MAEPSIGADEQMAALTSDFRLIQKRRGHRYSVDDMLVAHLAYERGGSPSRVLDLGCGLGSVLLITAWSRPATTLVGVELHAEQAAFARRNIALNNCEDRARVVDGDLRDGRLIESLGHFDLVTGTPPYFDPSANTLSADPARAAAHFELAGGIEDYAEAASQALSACGSFICCAGADPRGRAERSLERAGLTLSYRRQVIPREEKPPFLLLLIGTKAPAQLTEPPPLVLRDTNGRRTAEHRSIGVALRGHKQP